jgi:two-component system cell cycle response regulator
MEPGSQKPLLLLVDDEEGMRTGLAAWLAPDYEVLTAEDGNKARDLLRHLDRVPDVLLVDVWMPGLDGIEMVRRIRANVAWSRMPVIFLTGQTAVRTMIDGIASGARSYLMKPVDLDRLDRTLRGAVLQRRPAARASVGAHARIK